MPGFDKTGPRGSGPMTGGGFGDCAGAARGFGQGRGFGRGFRCRSPMGGPGWQGRGNGFGRRQQGWAARADDDADSLRARAAVMKRELEEMEKRLQEMEQPMPD